MEGSGYFMLVGGYKQSEGEEGVKSGAKHYPQPLTNQHKPSLV